MSDKGNNSKDNWALWQDSPFHFVGSLPVSDYSDLLEIPLTSYEQFDETEPELQGELSYRNTRKVLEDEYQLVVTYNPELFAGQVQGIEANIAKCQRELTLLHELNGIQQGLYHQLGLAKYRI